MRIIILSIALLFCAFSAQSQVLKSAGVWYFLDVDSMTARPAVLPNGTELAYVVGTKKIYYWNRTTSTWTEYSTGGGLTFNRDSIYFDSSIVGSGTVGDPWRVDSTLFATIAGVGDSIAAALADYVEIADTATMLTNYPTKAEVAANPTTIAANYLATSNGTNLVARNLFDNNTYVGVLNSKPFSFGTWTLAGRPTGSANYFGWRDGTTFEWYNGTRWAIGLESTFARGTATRVPFFDANGQVTDNAGISFVASTGLRVTTPISFSTSSPMVRIGMNSNTPTIMFEAASGERATIDNNGGDFRWVRNAATVPLSLQMSTGNLTSSGVLTTQGTGTNTFTGNIRANGTSNNIFNVSGGRFGIGTASPSNFFTVFNPGSGLANAFYGYANPGAGSGNGVGFQLENTNGISLKTQFVMGGTVASTKYYSFGNDVNGVGGDDYVVYSGFGNTTGIYLTSNGKIRFGLAGVPSLALLNTYNVHIEGTDGIQIPDGTEAQRPAIISGTHPLRFNTDSTALEYGESVGTYRQLATRAYARSLATSSPTTITTGHVAYSNGTSLVGSANHFWDNTNGFLGIKTATPLQELDVNGDAYIRDSTRLTTTPAHTAITGLLTRDATGWVGLASLAGGLSYSGGVLSASGVNTVYTASDSIRGDRYLEMANDGSKTTALGVFPSFPDFLENENRYGLYVSPGYWGNTILTQYSSNRGTSLLLSQFDAILEMRRGTTQTAYVGTFLDQAVLYGQNRSGSVTSTKMFVDSSGVSITPVISGSGSGTYKLISNTSSPPTTSAAKTVLQWTGDGSSANPAFVEVKRDTTIFLTADTDYDFSAAVTTAQIASRYNRIIIHMTLTSGVGADKTTTLHTPDANLMQCEILIRGTDNTGTYDNEIAFGTNNAISSDGTNTSGYTLAQGQGLHVRVVYNGSAYKYIYY